jgi:hypothetical protein
MRQHHRVLIAVIVAFAFLVPGVHAGDSRQVVPYKSKKIKKYKAPKIKRYKAPKINRKSNRTR